MKRGQKKGKEGIGKLIKRYESKIVNLRVTRGYRSPRAKTRPETTMGTYSIEKRTISTQTHSQNAFLETFGPRTSE